MVARAMKPHVLTLTDAIGDGGAERVALELALGTDPARFQRSLCVTRPPFDVPSNAAAVHYRRLLDEGISVLVLNRRNRLDIRPWWRLAAYLRTRHVDVIHAHKFGSNVWAALLGRALSVPVVIGHEHTWSFEGQQLRRLLDRLVVGRLSDAVIAVSEADRARMVGLIKMPPSRVVLIPNGISWPSETDSRAVRDELGIGSEVPVLALTAVLRPQKAIDVMLRAMAILRKTHPVVRLLLIGSGESHDLRAEAARLGVSDAVTFLGPRRNVPNILAASNVGVLSSDFEGSPLAVLEYMAAGLPVVATDVGGLPQMVEHGTTGLLVPPRDPGALAAGIARLLDEPALARAMGEQARARQRREFSSETMVRRVSDLYERLLSESGVECSHGARLGEVTAVD
jgi:glycosyltransferase involved in cell wall biosynthesis